MHIHVKMVLQTEETMKIIVEYFWNICEHKWINQKASQ